MVLRQVLRQLFNGRVIPDDCRGNLFVQPVFKIAGKGNRLQGVQAVVVKGLPNVNTRGIHVDHVRDIGDQPVADGFFRGRFGQWRRFPFLQHAKLTGRKA